MNTFTVKHPYNSPGHIALVEAFEDRKIVQHAGGPCVVLSRKTTGNAELVTSFELAEIVTPFERVDTPKEPEGVSYALLRGWAYNVAGIPRAELDDMDSEQILGAMADKIPIDEDHRDRAIRWLTELLNRSGYLLELPWRAEKIPGGWHVHSSNDDKIDSCEPLTEEIVAAVNAAHLRHDVGAFDVDVSSALAPEPKAAPPPPLERPEREPVMVVLGGLPETYGGTCVVIASCCAAYWYTEDGTMYHRRGHFSYMSPATNAMLTAYFDPPQTEATAALQSAAAELRECGVALREADERNSSLRSERAKLEAAIKSFDATLTDLTGHPRVSAETAAYIEEALQTLRGALR